MSATSGPPASTAPWNRPAAPAPAEVAAALAEADHIERRAAAGMALARWFGVAEYNRGYQDGYTQAEADMAESWHEIAEPVSHGRSVIAEGYERRLAAAAGYNRWAADQHWREFIGRAESTPPRHRTDVQWAVVRYLIPALRRRSA